MHYFLLGLGLLFAVIGLYRFFLSASVSQIKSLFLTGFFIAFLVGVFYLAITGKLPAAIGLLVAVLPFFYQASPFSKKNRQKKPGSSAPQSSAKISREEALEILGLDEKATTDDIKAAHKKLIKKIHPEQDGSEWMAAILNEARDKLLK